MKIAVLAYGSITRNLYSQYYEATLVVRDDFQESGLLIQTSFQDISCAGFPDKQRLCLLATSEPSMISRPTKLYYATHDFEDLELALDNFMRREGTEDPSHVGVIKHPKHEEPSAFCHRCLNPEKVKEIEEWLSENEYDYALIAQFPPNASLGEVQEFLKVDNDIKKRTLIYFLGLPKTTQETHRDALQYLGLDFEERTS